MEGFSIGGIFHRRNFPQEEFFIGGIFHKRNFPGGTFLGGIFLGGIYLAPFSSQYVKIVSGVLSVYALCILELSQVFILSISAACEE